MSSELKLTQFKALLFDVYATLIDWEDGIYNGLHPLLTRIKSPLAQSKRDLLLAFTSVETDLQHKYPTMLYADILAHVHAELAARLTNTPSRTDGDSDAVGVTATSTNGGSTATAGTSSSADQGPSSPTRGLTEEDVAFGKSIPRWPVFPDTIPALATLSKHYKLTVLSNVDHASFSGTRAILERSDPAHPFAFDAVYTAQDIGSYKPDPANFEYALRKLDEQFGIRKEEVLCVAASLTHDHVPANRLGIRSVYIDREGAAIGKDGAAKYDWKFATLGEMAEAVEGEAK
ncbi:hypothetical protein EW026_g7953 [Hermanssonia centrifuga]|uniref:Haloacid dehalogenase n=1 Tax=Hermanssonia centrifuga TaxID=98765 RepID=A0A4V3X990_9APHY|nr:hypothetical protein EW026_g7953 [Hermanssonia centrifuga]